MILNDVLLNGWIMTKESSSSGDEEIQDLSRVSEEITSEFLRMFSTILGEDLTADLTDDDLNELNQKIENLLSEVIDLVESEPDQRELADLLLERLLESTNESLGIEFQSETVHERVLELSNMFDEIMANLRSEFVELGHPEYYNKSEEIADKLVESDKASEFIQTVDSEVFDEDGIVLLQQIMSKHEDHMKLIRDHPEVNDPDVAEKYLRSYERQCETFRKYIPQYVFANDLLNDRDPSLPDLSGKRLDTYLQMLSSNKRSEICIFANPIDNDIRNSIAHDDYLSNPVDNIVKFKDEGELVTEMPYDEIKDLVIEAKCMTMSLFFFHPFVNNKENSRKVKSMIEELRSE